MENEPQYWFRARRYGWGWTPCTLEGWIVTIFAGFALVGGDLTIALFAREVAHSTVVEWRLSAGGYIGIVLGWNALVLVPVIWICWKTAEAPGWRWGNRGDGAASGSDPDASP